uniref:G_PROTEIN_RECEP_F1_2 domain-containing protein n=1 Tax=Parastrongyloides trichosuri TaxID=131310 RepID=A0A0N4Z4W2_PARTI
MYLFTKTFLSNCPDEEYCYVITILGVIVLIVQISVSVLLLREWKTTKSPYTKFLAIVRTLHIFYTLLAMVIGGFRTFLPRLTVICYGLIRYVDDIGCGLSFVGLILHNH